MHDPKSFLETLEHVLWETSKSDTLLTVSNAVNTSEQSEPDADVNKLIMSVAQAKRCEKAGEAG